MKGLGIGFLSILTAVALFFLERDLRMGRSLFLPEDHSQAVC